MRKILFLLCILGIGYGWLVQDGYFCTESYDPLLQMKFREGCRGGGSIIIFSLIFMFGVMFVPLLEWWIKPSKSELKRQREEEKEKELREKEERELRKIKEEKERLKREKKRELKLKERLEREKKLEILRKKKEFWFELSGLNTEKELNKVFKQLGYKAKLTPRSNDEGIDHVLDKNIVVQTKNQKKKVSRPDMQRFWGSWKDSHEKGIFVSIYGFANTCEEFVKDKPILLYDVKDVIRMSEGKKPEWNE